MNLDDQNINSEIERLSKLNGKYFDELVAEINFKEIEADMQKTLKDLELNSNDVYNFYLPDVKHLIDEIDKLLK
ncbi:MAG TPA: hypothetical protein PLC38_03915 [Methanobacterium sp.]|jgi:hypothetical protein|nr:MAG: hypothetical protein FGO69_10160 [Methanobacterium sp.]HOI71414.1 hypothetical protein [Methanobacterium sp.]